LTKFKLIKERGQISIFLLFTIFALLTIATLFISKITLVNDYKETLELDYKIKEIKELDAIKNSMKKGAIYEPISGPYITEKDSNILDHYG